MAPRPGDSLVTFTAPTWGAGWGALQNCDFDDLVVKGGSIDGHQASLSLLPARGVAVIALSNFGQTQPHAFESWRGPAHWSSGWRAHRPHSSR